MTITPYHSQLDFQASAFRLQRIPSYLKILSEKTKIRGLFPRFEDKKQEPADFSRNLKKKQGPGERQKFRVFNPNIPVVYRVLRQYNISIYYTGVIFENVEKWYMNSLTSSRWPNLDNCKEINKIKTKMSETITFCSGNIFRWDFLQKNIYVVWKPRIWTSSWISRPGESRYKSPHLAYYVKLKFQNLRFTYDTFLVYTYIFPAEIFMMKPRFVVFRQRRYFWKILPEQKVMASDIFAFYFAVTWVYIQIITLSSWGNSYIDVTRNSEFLYKQKKSSKNPEVI